MKEAIAGACAAGNFATDIGMNKCMPRYFGSVDLLTRWLTTKLQLRYIIQSREIIYKLVGHLC